MEHCPGCDGDHLPNYECERQDEDRLFAEGERDAARHERDVLQGHLDAANSYIRELEADTKRLRDALEYAVYGLERADGVLTKHWACDFAEFSARAARARKTLSSFKAKS